MTIVSIAPMMNCTDRHDRYFLRLIAPHVLLYTEMLTAQAVCFGDRKKLLAFDALEHPVALQLGSYDPHLLKQAAQYGADCGYDEINLNVGCPSPRVKAGRFGACLMLEPTIVAECVATMQSAVTIPVTVKCRLGVDQYDSDSELQQFIEQVAQAGCKKFIVHARKAWLKGLSPRENRDIPPLQYERVYQVKAQFPELTIIINGGIRTVSAIETHLQHVDGVMIGREAYYNPYFLAEIEQTIFNYQSPSRAEIIELFLPYVRNVLAQGHKLSHVTRHILGLFQAQLGAAKWRRYISEHAHLPHANEAVLQEAISIMSL